MELAKHPKVVCTPHLGASTSEAQLRVAGEIAEQIVDAVNGKPMVGLVSVCLNHTLKIRDGDLGLSGFVSFFFKGVSTGGGRYHRFLRHINLFLSSSQASQESLF